MSDDARAKAKGEPPSEHSEEVESWLREAVRAPQAARLPSPGDVVGGKYRIEDLLGRGGMGAVFRARHVVSEKPVAIKWMLRPATDSQARRRFEREARAAGRIDHPNVVVLYDLGDEGDCSYLVMELLRGESLRNRLSRGTLTPKQAVDTLIPAMRGVAAAHRAGVIHRDLKPDNIFLCTEPESGSPREAKVLDFGVSSITSVETGDSTLTEEGTLLGSLAYMSPEQLTSPHDVDARTDVYAFGVILYEVVTGGLPFRGASHGALIVAIATAQPTRPSQVQSNLPPGLEEVIMRALARDRDNRYPGMNSLIEALLPFATSLRESSSPVPADLAQHGLQAGAPAHETRAERRASRPGAIVVPAPTTGGGLPLGYRPDRWYRSRAALAAAALLTIAALWALASLLRSAEPPVARPIAPALPQDDTAVNALEAPAAPAPASAAKAEPAQLAKQPEPAPAAAAPAPETKPALATPRAKSPRARGARPGSATGGRRASSKSKNEADEDSLFSGRK